MPSALGPRTLPTSPASTTNVTIYGVISSRLDWIGVLRVDDSTAVHTVHPQHADPLQPAADDPVYRHDRRARRARRQGPRSQGRGHPLRQGLKIYAERSGPHVSPEREPRHGRRTGAGWRTGLAGSRG